MISTEEKFLDMIPAGKFHSAFVLGYNFDFYYFEYIVVNKLRLAGVTNLIVLVDSARLSESLGNLMEHLSARKAGYSIHGIRCPGSFHPKMILLAGEKAGFVIVGSGNPTAGGYGANRELWGAFHIDDPTQPAAQLFRKAWQYVLKFQGEIDGLARQKFDWFSQYAPWIQEIPESMPAGMITMEEGFEADFIDARLQPPLQSLRAYMDPEKIDQITLFAPFFDQRLAALSEIKNMFPNSRINVLLQLDKVVFPNNIPDDLKRGIRFYDWHTAFHADKGRYLHAKFLHFRSPEAAYCLLGSANLSLAALGDARMAPKNEEACLLLKRKDGNWLSDLGIADLDGCEPLDITTVQFPCDTHSDAAPDHASPAVTKRIRFTAADLDGRHLEVYFEKLPADVQGILSLHNASGKQVDKFPFPSGQVQIQNDRLSVELGADEDSERLFYLVMLDPDQAEELSNRIPIHHAESIINASPDPRQREFHILLSEIEAGNRHFYDVFQYLNTSDFFDGDKQVASYRQSASGKIVDAADPEAPAEEEPEQLDYETFTRDRREGNPGEAAMQLQSTVIYRVYEWVSTLMKQQEQRDEERRADEEETAETDLSGEQEITLEEETIPRDQPPVLVNEFQKAQRKMWHFFQRYLGMLQQQVEQSQLLHNRDLTLGIVSLQLLISSVELPISCRVKVEKDKNSARKPVSGEEASRTDPPDPDEYEEVEKILLSAYADPFAGKCFVGISLQVIGKLLLLRDIGYDATRYEVQSSRQETLFTEAYRVALFSLAVCDLIADQSVSDEAPLRYWIWACYMNIFKHLRQDLPDFEMGSEHFETLYRHFPLRDKFPLSQIMDRLKEFEPWMDAARQNITPALMNECHRFRAFLPDLDLYCAVNTECTGGDKFKAYLSHPGYPAHDKINDFIGGKIFLIPPAKVVVLGERI